MQLPAIFSALTARYNARKGSIRRRGSSKLLRPQVETLEPRKMLSGDSVTWQVQSAYEGASATASEARDIRGLALSPDDSAIYAGFIQGTGLGTEQVIEIPSSVQGAGLIDTTQTTLQGNIAPLIADTGPLAGQPKGVAVDNRGDVYATLNSSSNASTQEFAIYPSDLSSASEYIYSIPENLGGPATTGQVSGLQVQQIGGSYYLYVVNGKANDGDDALERFNVTDPSAVTMDTSFGNVTGGAVNLTTLISNWNTANPTDQLANGSTAVPVNGVAVAADGTIYLPISITGGGNSPNGGNGILEISADGSTLLGFNISDNVNGAYSAALYGGNVYVSQYNNTTSSIVELRQSDLSYVQTLSPLTADGISPHTSAEGTDSGFDGIAISATGQIYVADEAYDALSQLNPQTNEQDTYVLDRILVSSPLDQAGPITSNATATASVNYSPSASITVTSTVDDTTTGNSTIAEAQYSLDGSTWIDMTPTSVSNGGATEDASATFTLASVGITTQGTKTVYFRGIDTAGNTGGTISTTFDVEPPLLQPVDYVDATWTDLTNPGASPPALGDSVTDGTVTATYGVNAFSTIQAGVNALQVGGTTYVDAGTYAEQVSINKQVTLDGAQAGVDARTRGGAESILAANVNGDTPLTIGANDVVINGFTIEGNTNANNVGAGIYIVPGTSGTQFINNIVQDNLVGLDLANNSPTDQAVVEDNLFQNNTQPGANSGNDIYADQYTAGSNFQNVLIQDNEFTNTTSVEDTWGIGISNTSSTAFTNIQILDNQFSNSGRGMYFYNSSNVTVSGNTISGATHYAVGLFGNDGTPANTSFDIEQNTMNGTGDGIDIEDGGDATSPAFSGSSLDISDNLLENGNAGVLITQYALDTSTATTVAIDANTISGNGYGIQLYGNNDDTSITHNFITDNTVAGVLVDPTLTGLGPIFVNSFSGNTYGIANGSSVTLSAFDDWWGSATGPTNAANPAGTGDVISGPVDFVPFLTDGIDSDPNTPGFQHALAVPTLTVSDPSGAYTAGQFAATADVAGVGSQSTPAPSLEGFSPAVTYYSGTDASGSPLSGAPTTVGTYTVLANFAGSADYGSAASAQATFSITQARPTVSISGGSYNGTAYPVTGSVAGVGSQSTPAPSLEGVSPTVSYFRGGTPLGGAPTVAGTYTAVGSFAGSIDYTSANVTTTFTTSKALPTITVTDASGAYNDSTFVATDSVAPLGGMSPPGTSLEGVPLSLVYYPGTITTGSNWTTAAPKTPGTYTALATFIGSANYGSAAASVTFTIAKAAPTLTVTDAGGTYHDATFPATDTVAGVGAQSTPGANLEVITPKLSYYSGTTTGGAALPSAPSAAGTYTVVASYAGSSDYASGSVSTTFVIAQALPSVTVTEAGGAYTSAAFNATAKVAGVGAQSGAANSLEGVSPTFVYYPGATTSGSALSGSPTAAGSYTVVADFAGSTDYSSASASALFTITPAAPKVTVGAVSGSLSNLATDITAHVAGVGSQSATASSLEGISPTFVYYPGTNTSGSPLVGAPTTAGTFTVVASFAGSTDYASAKSTAATFIITKGTPTLVVTPTSGGYNTGAFTATDTVNGGASLENVAPMLEYYHAATLLSGPPTAAGTYEVFATFAGSVDYTSITSSASFTISKATPTVTVTDAGGAANGTLSFPATETVAGVGSQSTPAASLEGVTPTLVYYPGTATSGNNGTTAAPKAVGTYTAVATFAGSADYLTGTANVTFTVIPDPFITATSGSGQTAAADTPFAQAFTTRVVNTSGNPVSGAAVTFTAPSSGAGGAFAGGLTSVVVATNASGVATAPAFTANSVSGSYSVIASTPGAAVSATFTLANQYVVSAADPINPGHTALFVGGAAGNDQIHVEQSGNDLEVIITAPTASVNQLVPIPSGGFSRLVIHGGPNQNQIQVDSQVTTPTWIYADGTVSNNVQVGSGPSLVIGGAGANTITGGSGRDVLMAGAGKSTIQAGSGDALIIAGATDYDANDLALQAILDEWSSTDSLSTRQTELSNGSLMIGALSVALTSSTVHSNEQQNTLAGSSPTNNDLFFANLASAPDTIVDPDITEQIV